MGNVSEIPWLDLTVVVAYLLVITIVGCALTRRTQSARAFMTAGGRLPSWVVGMSIAGTFVSSISFLANPAGAYSGNWNPFLFSLSLPYAAWCATRWFIPWFRQSTTPSAYSLPASKFGRWAGRYAAVMNVVYHIFRIGMILFPVSLAVSYFVPLTVTQLILGLGLLVIVYTLLGGIEAVIWTDVLQTVVLIGGLLVCVGIALGCVPGGLPAVIESASAAESGKLSLGTMRPDFSVPSFWMTLLFGFVANLQNFAADQTYVQRYFTAKSDAAAARSVWAGALAYVPISFLLFLLGTVLFVLYRDHALLPPGVEARDIVPWFITERLSPGLAGLLLAAILAAAMSTIDSSLNSSATLIETDLLSSRHPGDERRTLRRLRYWTILIGCIGVGAAMAMQHIEELLQTWWLITGIVSGGTLGLMILARLPLPVTGRDALTALMLGLLAVTALTLAGEDLRGPFCQWLSPVVPNMARWLEGGLEQLRSLLHPRMALVAGTGIMALYGTVVGLLRRRLSRCEGTGQRH